MTNPAHSPATWARDLSHAYEKLHTAKEDAFWTAYMGLADDPDQARTELNEREIELNRFLQDPARLRAARDVLARAEADHAGDEVVTALRGWVRTLEAHAIDSAAARGLAEEIVEREGRLARARGSMELGYREQDGTFVPASSVKLGVMLVTDRDEARRRSAYEGLLSIEKHVLENGFLDVVRERNRLGRMLGGEDYYDWKVRRVEGQSKAEIFALLHELEERTRERARASLDGLRAREGERALRPWNVRHLVAGDITSEQDPYFPFSRALDRWGRSFAALGIGYRGATMVLDLVDRKGKYENGFMHGPVPAWRENGEFRPARIQFTANAIPGMVGSGKRAAQTLFHEGGHAAHFANIDMPAPCFAQEFAPTSVAFAETQSMFLDSLLADADWQQRYACTVDGAPMPWELIEKGIRTVQPFAAWMLRMQVAIPYCERAIYEIPDGELTAERVLAEVRAAERTLLFLDDPAPRPALSVPHLLAGESSAYYHGYILARMAVEQTRRFFFERDGHLMDNPRIGPDLARAYWQPGNSRGFFELVSGLTGAQVSARALADRVNLEVDDAVRRAREKADRAAGVPRFGGEVDLDATIRVAHGRETVADTSAGFAAAAEQFARWIESRQD